jgi:3-hydroxypropanoate dehydrogenase
MPALRQKALDLLFLEARTHNGWRRKKVSLELLEDIWNIARMGPTSANSQPLRVVFVVSEAAKKKLAPALSKGNLDKTMKAPVTALFAYDLKFYDLLARLFPHDQSARSWFADKEATIEETAFRNGTLQAAYFMLAARAKGLDCGPMSGFNQEKVNQAFFPEGSYKVNFICSLGYGTDEKLFPRLPRLEFSEACRVE